MPDCTTGQTIILCAKCLKLTPGTRHHLLPKRFYGCDKDSPILYICRKCHDLLERIIPQHTKLKDEEYIAIAIEFLQPQAMILEFPTGRRRR